MDNTIEITRLLSIDDVVALARKMGDVALSDDLFFDFAGLQYVKTLPAALFARELRLFVAKRHADCLKTYCIGHDDDKSAALSYLAFVGFFDFIGLSDFGCKVRRVAEVDGRYPYLAITKYNYQRFKVAAEYDPYRSEYDYIDEEARKIAGLMKTSDERNSLFSYAVREIMRNAYEHSGSADFYAMGQSWPDGSLELVVMDDGNGILSTLKGKYPKLASEKEAILASLRPGVSGVDFTGENKFNNSGFGLYVLSEFARKYGSMTMVSGGDLVSFDASGERCEKVSDDGTFVGLCIRSVPQNAKSVINNIISEGEKVSVQGEYPVRPSKQTWNF